MTAPETAATAEGRADGLHPPVKRPRLRTAGSLVDQRLGGGDGLQARILRDESGARGSLAALRRAASKAPGEVPETWSLTEVPANDQTGPLGDSPTWNEIAVHTAITLYAVHQQSRTTGMFRPGVGLGGAARKLIGPADQENPSARARFNALVTSTTLAELQHHLRTFVSLLRSQDIGLDHAMLADDIVDFQRPGCAKRVRLRWARQYSFTRQNEDDAQDAADASSQTLN